MPWRQTVGLIIVCVFTAGISRAGPGNVVAIGEIFGQVSCKEKMSGRDGGFVGISRSDYHYHRPWAHSGAEPNSTRPSHLNTPCSMSNLV